ncbi:MAG TPA: glycine betaine ABC transporter substrate-binding protein [Polyangia bacterium]|jgi:glycine betaine/choline ABC-type transport system substrate-binding protein
MKILSGIIALVILALAGEASACVGKTITIGVPDAPDERVLGELVALLVTERTGTTARVTTFADGNQVLAAVKRGDVGTLVESTARALQVLGKPPARTAQEAYTVAKEGYRARFSLVWLDPFAAGKQARSLFGPVLTTEVVRTFPALPRVINKLTKVLTAEELAQLAAAARAGKDLKALARDYLRAKKLI